MNNLPFRKPGRFYRGNLHTHSNRSDGELPPEEVIAAYRAQGYDFLALTDHFLPQYHFPITDTRAFRDARFTTLPGAELHAPADICRSIVAHYRGWSATRLCAANAR
jgi:histidinol phosphatase-like PHP family hydrolase